MKKLLLATSVLANLTWGIPYADAQNPTCPNRPNGDSSNACANTRFVMNNGGGGGGGSPGGLNGQVQYNNSGAFGGLTDVQLTARIQAFTSSLSGAAPASGGGTTNFLRADGAWAQTGGGFAPVGTIVPWAGATIPTGYLLAYGQAVLRATYPDLLTAITLASNMTCTSGSPTVPVSTDISDRTPIGAPLEASACFAPGSIVISKASGLLTFSTNAIASTTTAFKVFPWGNGDGSTTFNVPNLQGRSAFGRDNMSGTAQGILTSTYFGANPDAIGAIGGTQSQTLQTANLPAYTPTGTITTTTTLTNGTTIQRNTAGSMAPGVAGGAQSVPFINTVNITAASSSSFTGVAQGGSSTAFGLVNPGITLDWIIKAIADATNGDTIVVGTTIVANGVNTNILYNNNGILGEYALATLSDMYAGTAANKIVTPSVAWPTEVTVTYGTTTTFDMSTFRDAVVTLTGNITTMTVSNVVVGKAGSITFIQDGSGGHTTVWDSKFKFTGGTTPTLTATAGAVDILSYSCRTATFCFAAMMNDVK